MTGRYGQKEIHRTEEPARKGWDFSGVRIFYEGVPCQAFAPREPVIEGEFKVIDEGKPK